MGKIRINKSSVDELQPGAHRFVVWDDKQTGFGVEVQPSGAKSYKLMYRAAGRLRKLTLGRHGAITAEEARNLAKKALGAVAFGSDPAEQKIEARRAQSLATAFEDWLDTHIDARRKPVTRTEYRRLFVRDIKPVIGSKALKGVTRADVLALHRRLSKSPYVANRVVATLRSFFTWCERHELRPLNSNPAKLVEFHKEVRRERCISGEEFAKLGEALRGSEELESPWTIAAILLLMFTGARRGEILGLHWSDIDLGAGTARLRDSKTGVKSIYLSAAARSVLERVPRRADNPHVICGEKRGQPLIGLPRAWRRIRTRAGLADLRIHDLRHAFASAGALNGTPLLTIGKLLGHSQPAVTDRYAHLASAPLVQVADQIAGAIERQMSAAIDFNNEPRKRGCHEGQ